MNIKKYRAFIESLEGEKGLPEEMYGIRFDESLEKMAKETYGLDGYSGYFVLHLIERCRRAESRQIPDLKEKVKELMRDAMDAAENPPIETRGGPYGSSLAEQFRALCAEVKP